MQDSLEELVGTVKKIVFRNEENGWTVFQLESGPQSITVTGLFARVHVGEYLRLVGRQTQHKIFGQQFSSQRKVPHDTVEGITRYLASRLIKGIGTKTAQKIVIGVYIYIIPIKHIRQNTNTAQQIIIGVYIYRFSNKKHKKST